MPALEVGSKLKEEEDEGCDREGSDEAVKTRIGPTVTGRGKNAAASSEENGGSAGGEPGKAARSLLELQEAYPRQLAGIAGPLLLHRRIAASGNLDRRIVVEEEAVFLSLVVPPFLELVIWLWTHTDFIQIPPPFAQLLNFLFLFGILERNNEGELG